MADINSPSLLVPLYLLIGTYCLILTPLSVVYLCQLWKLSSENIPFFTKRHPKLIIVSGILFNIYPTILRPFADLTRAHGLYSYDHALTGVIVNLMQWYLLFEYMRLWLLYFDYQYSLHTLSLKWKQQILQQEAHIPWTLKYRWLGNVKVLCLISGLFGAIFLLIVEGGPIFGYGQSLHNLIQLLPMLCTLLMLIIAFKVRKCRDEFMIQEEFKIYGVSLIAMIILYITIAFTVESNTNARYILMNMFTCLCCYVMVFVSTFWSIQQYNKQMRPPPPILINQISTEDIQKKLDNRLTLEQILSTRDGFDLFANHLVKEFSIENLFFIFEMVQIKNELITNQLISEQDVGVMIPINFHRVDQLRRQNSNIYSVEDMRTNIAYIIHQYIIMDGVYSVNISCDTRFSLQDAYKKLNLQYETADKEMIKVYIELFDDSMQEIIDLMRDDSLARFYQSEEYHNFTKNNAKHNVDA